MIFTIIKRNLIPQHLTCSKTINENQIFYWSAKIYPPYTQIILTHNKQCNMTHNYMNQWALQQAIGIL